MPRFSAAGSAGAKARWQDAFSFVQSAAVSTAEGLLPNSAVSLAQALDASSPGLRAAVRPAMRSFRDVLLMSAAWRRQGALCLQSPGQTCRTQFPALAPWPQ